MSYVFYILAYIVCCVLTSFLSGRFDRKYNSGFPVLFSYLGPIGLLIFLVGAPIFLILFRKKEYKDPLSRIYNWSKK